MPRSDGEFLHLLVKVARAKRVLEIGTANGYSAIWLALALEETDGQLRSPSYCRSAGIAQAGSEVRSAWMAVPSPWGEG